MLVIHTWLFPSIVLMTKSSITNSGSSLIRQVSPAPLFGGMLLLTLTPLPQSNAPIFFPNSTLESRQLSCQPTMEEQLIFL